MRFMRQCFYFASLLMMLASSVLAQSIPSWLAYKKVPDTKQWRDFAASKQDVLGFQPISIGGGILTGPLYILPSSASSAGINLGVGLAPASPRPGDLWVTSTGIFAYINGQVLNLGGGGGGGGGSVTSVGVTVPSRQTVTGSPVTSSGTIVITDNPQQPNLIYAGPASGSPAPPAFRPAVPADLPSFVALIGGSPSNGQLAQWSNGNTIQGLTIGSGVGSALGSTIDANGGFALVNGSPIVGNCLKWSATGVQDAGGVCGSGGSGGGWNGAFPVSVSSVASGGVPYFSDSTHMASSPVLAASKLMRGGGAGNPPQTFDPGGDATFNGNNFTVSAINGVAPGPLYAATSVNLATQTSGNLSTSHFDSGINADAFHCLSGSPIVGGAWTPCSGNTVYSIPSSPIGTSSATFVMMGLANTFIPKKGGDVMIVISGSMSNSTPPGTCIYTVYYGTGAPPANGVAPPTGAKQLGTAIPSPTAVAPFSANGMACFSSLGTSYWVDLAVRAVGGGTCTPANISFSSIEN
jgi:hypothetical protein